MSSSWIFVAFFEFFAAALLLCLLAGVLRGVRSASWPQTKGRIKTFGMTQGVPGVLYEYQVEGADFSSGAIIPGAFFCGKRGTAAAPKGTCINLDGSLKFKPGAEVDVFYNTCNPADAVLVPGIQVQETVKLALITVVLGVVPLAGWQNRAWVSLHEKACILGFFFLGGMLGVVIALFFLRRCLQTRDYPFVRGRLLKAEVVYDAGSSENGGYLPTVDYEYEVEGTCYQSQQLTAIPVRTLTRQESAQAKVDRLLASPELRVYYNPRAPWEAFLQQGPYWGLAIPLVISAAFTGFGIVMYFKLGFAL